ncbi:carboxypeptidase-like regulatory domain-containing protein [Polaribacter sp. L3A8]|uniref:carboxypeptidase-like regulatory domain-containing protein n=1 Tax=Polaribacter sp. L3A8 TaxID=2686361 RepID=UPI001E546243|nr:carboxypeptidase-like regulatory domain-containing protein [Polaribacter sp. L3A8]
MKTQFNLSIKTPCSEKFNNFTKTNNGGFCNSCNKEVIDFTKMTSHQIIQYFKKPKNDTCGVFNKTQLTSYQEKTIPKNRWQFRTLAGFSLSIISLFSINEIKAQEQKNNTEIHKNILTNKIVSTEQQKPQIVKGVISDADGVLPGASIVLKGTTIGVVTNFDGEFTFPKPLQKGDILMVSYLGYKTENVFIKENKLDIKLNYNLELKLDSCIIMGKVATKEVFKTKRSLWRKLTSKN